MEYCARAPLRLRQVPSEILAWTKLLAEAAPRRSLEIGTYRGGTLFLLCNFSAPDAQIISLDLPKGGFGGGYKWFSIPLFKSFPRKDQQLHLLRADSHQPASFARVLKLLSGSPLDLLFIDGDHSYEGVKRDFEMYAPLVRPGGLIVLHDIAVHTLEPHCEVSRFWEEIKVRYKHRELIEDPRQGWAGIGILEVAQQSDEGRR